MKPEKTDRDRQKIQAHPPDDSGSGASRPFVVVMLVFGTVVYYFGTNLKSRVTTELVRIAEDHRRLVEQFLGEGRQFEFRGCFLSVG